MFLRSETELGPTIGSPGAGAMMTMSAVDGLTLFNVAL